MDVLVVGGGAREHALCRALATDDNVEGLHCAPGNAGTADIAETHQLDIGDPDAVAKLAVDLDVDLVVIGPEVPLVAGAADAVHAAGIDCFGPSREAAQLEGSKSFAKEVMTVAGVPTGRAHTCTTVEEVAAALDDFGPPYVVKDDGLAAGKGVVVTEDRDEALAHAADFNRVVVEEYLDGPEVSLFCVTDGTTVVPLVPAQDFKRVGDGDSGPNTGGMGAYSPLPWATSDLPQQVVAQVAQPTVDELRRRGKPFSGLLYVGLALTSKGMRVIEFNARFGDPETQVVLARLESSISTLLRDAARGELDKHGPLRWSDHAAVTVVIAANGYPASVRIGDAISGIDVANEQDDAYVLHAGTKQEGELVVSSGGRVLSVVGIGPDVKSARDAAYRAVEVVTLAGAHYRTDIASSV